MAEASASTPERYEVTESSQAEALLLSPPGVPEYTERQRIAPRWNRGCRWNWIRFTRPRGARWFQHRRPRGRLRR